MGTGRKLVPVIAACLILDTVFSRNDVDGVGRLGVQVMYRVCFWNETRYWETDFVSL